MKRKTRRTIVFEMLLVGAILAIALIALIPKPEILGLAIKEDSLVNTGNMGAEVDDGDKIKVIFPEQEIAINKTENKTYFGRKNE